jgi:hypothetical protein
MNILGSITWYFVMRRQVDFELGNVYTYAIDTYRLAYRQGMKLIGRKKQEVQS